MYVTSTKGLAGIRDAVWGLLANELTHRSWDVVCRRLLDKPLLFWEDLMQQLFLDRLQVRWEVHRPAARCHLWTVWVYSCHFL